MRLRYFTLFFCLFSLTACSKIDEHYYRLHPPALQAALKQCPQKNNFPVSCARLKALAQETSKLAYELQLNPQAFGQSIMDLQEQLAIAQKAGSEAEKVQINEIENKLQARLAVVRWLESPENY